VALVAGGARHPGSLIWLGRWMIDFEPPNPPLAESPRSPVIARTDDHDLVDAISDGVNDLTIKEARPRRHTRRLQARQRETAVQTGIQPTLDLDVSLGGRRTVIVETQALRGNPPRRERRPIWSNHASSLADSALRFPP
jgi:hypothetical protein